ncbi:MAG: Mur ligase domain-containing protein [Kiritimatiellia bacterium]
MLRKEHVHVVGVAGSGMCAAAEASLACGFCVTGSDRHVDQKTPVAVIARLQHAGCTLYPQDGSAITQDTAAVIVSTAIEPDNPDVARALALSVRVYHRTEWLSRLIANRTLIGIAGTSGKSTVTAMVGWILSHWGRDPFVVNGAAVSAWEADNRSGQVRHGTQDLWVLELDESDRSLLRFRPQQAVITNQSADHFSMQETEALFASFQKQVQGQCIRGPWQLERFVSDAAGCRFESDGVAYQLPIPGRHNAENAIAAASLCACLGVSREASAAALTTFPGVRRRLERCVPSGTILVFDDFAHNPAKIEAAIETIRPLAQSLSVVWRPHGYGPLRSMMPDLVKVFGRLAKTNRPNQHNRLLLLPVYDVGGTAQRDVQSGDLALRLRPLGVEVYCLATYDEVRAACAPDVVQAGDAVLVMGARDPGLADLAKSIASMHQTFMGK